MLRIIYKCNLTYFEYLEMPNFELTPPNLRWLRRSTSLYIHIIHVIYIYISNMPPHGQNRRMNIELARRVITFPFHSFVFNHVCVGVRFFVFCVFSCYCLANCWQPPPRFVSTPAFYKRGCVIDICCAIKRKYKKNKKILPPTQAWLKIKPMKRKVIKNKTYEPTSP